MAITRKVFLVQLVGGGWALAGCGGGGYGSSPAPATGAGCTATISANHGHTLAISAADLNSMGDTTRDITGTADHSHMVTFTVADLGQLKLGYMVPKTSTMSVATMATPAHDHAISDLCS